MVTSAAFTCMKPITIAINLTSQEEAQLAGILGKSPSDLPDTLAPHALAAVEEYVRMFLGQKVFTRGSDIREFRLFLLIRTAFANRIPNEQEVSALFQCTQSQSRALIRAVMSKYQYDLNKAIESTLAQTIGQVRKDPNGKWIVVISSENIADALNQRLASIDSAQDQVVRKTGKLATYELTRAAYEALCGQFKIKPLPK
jgi:hypothetical protein